MLTGEQHRKFIKALLATPSTSDMQGRTALLTGLPTNIRASLDRNGNAYTDLTNIISQLDRLGNLKDTGENPLVILAENALMQVEGTDAADILSEIISDLEKPDGGNAVPADAGPDVKAEIIPAGRMVTGQVFISYAREDLDMAERLFHDLTSNGINAWLDRKKLLPGQRWKTFITKAIHDSSHFLALFSSNSISKRGYFQKELKKALDILDEFSEYEIYFIPARIDDCEPSDEKLGDIHWADLFPSYEHGLNQILQVLELEKDIPEAVVATAAPVKQADTGSILKKTKQVKYPLRHKSLTVSDEEFIKVFKLNEDFRPLEYIRNEYKDNGDGTVTDHATGLMWQQSGSDDYLFYKDAQEYVNALNSNTFAGYSDWRMPTIDELVSLLEPEKQENELYINPIFDKKQMWCWSSDRRLSGGAWDVLFDGGLVYWVGDFSYVRCVRA